MSSAIPEPIRFCRHIVSVGQIGAEHGALIVNGGELDGGTPATQVFAQRLKKPSLVVQRDHGVMANVFAQVLEWVRQREIKTLNVAGLPKESDREFTA